jgi:hypothetical protein
MVMSEQETEFDWSPLGEAWWMEAAATCGATPLQARFGCCRHRGMTQAGAARLAGYGGGPDGVRKAGSQAAKSTAVCNMMALAQAETSTGDDGVVGTGEARRILSRLARGSDPNVRIKALDSLQKIEDRQRAERLRDDGPSDHVSAVRAVILSIPCYGPALACGMWADNYGIETFPFLRECAPLLANKFPEDWARWRGRRPDPGIDAMAAGPILSADEIVTALKIAAPRVNGSARHSQEAETEQEAASDAA